MGRSNNGFFKKNNAIAVIAANCRICRFWYFLVGEIYGGLVVVGGEKGVSGGIILKNPTYFKYQVLYINLQGSFYYFKSQNLHKNPNYFQTIQYIFRQFNLVIFRIV